MKPQAHEPSNDITPPHREDAAGRNMAVSYCGMLIVMVIGNSCSIRRASNVGSPKVYDTYGLDLIFKCLLFGAVACGLLGMLAYFTRSRDTRWLYYTLLVVLSLLSFFMVELKPLVNFRR